MENRKAEKQALPGNVREAVLEGFDVMAASYLAQDRFTGPNTIVRTGEVVSEDGFVIPFTAKIEFDRPRRVTA